MTTKHFGLSLVAVLTMAVAVSCGSPEPGFREAGDPVAVLPAEDSLWNLAGKGLNAGWVSADFRYSRSTVPEAAFRDTLKIAAWKGERVSGQFLLWTMDGTPHVSCVPGLLQSESGSIGTDCQSCRFVRYTLADTPEPECRCNKPEDHPFMLVPDMLDNIQSMDIEARTVRPVWFSADVPRDAGAGVYVGEVAVKSGRRTLKTLPVKLTVIDRTLPSPDEWTYHLDLWQHPSAVARTSGTEMWSDGHFEALRSEMSLLADAGQKVITCTLNRDPWNHQCYDGYENMISWTFGKDGSWSYDYTVFDRWVTLMMSLGVDKMINCYSMVPWNCLLDYYDEATSEMKTVEAKPGTELFEQMWRPFLKDFKQHLASKGWLEITNIAMDERSPQEMDAAATLLQECAPEMGFAIADNHQSYRKYTMMRDVCVDIRNPMDSSDVVSRRGNGFTSTFYACCSTAFPNTYTYSEPYEAELLVLYGEAMGYDGMLRWAYNSWPEDPCFDSRFGHFGSGDTYFVYPGARSSMRFERLRDGIETAEKIRLLRENPDCGDACVEKIDRSLSLLLDHRINDPGHPWPQLLQKITDVSNGL